MSIKKLIALLVIVFSLATPAMGADYIEANGIILNGSKVNLDVKPIVISGRTMVPVRFILEELGMKVTWNAEKKTAIGEKEGVKIELYTGEDYSDDWENSYYNGIEISRGDVGPVIINNRTLVSVRMVADLLGLDIEWDGKNKNVILDEVPEPNISLDEAYNMLNDEKSDNSRLGFKYMPYESYAAKNYKVIENYYVFGVFDKQYGNMWDLNLCVNKETGEIEEYLPDLGIEGDIAFEARDYILNGQSELSNAYSFHWDETLLKSLPDETINDLYASFVEAGGNKYSMMDFAEYMYFNAPIQSNWKEVFEESFLASWTDKTIERYEYWDNGFCSVYVEGIEIPIVNVNMRTGYYSGM